MKNLLRHLSVPLLLIGGCKTPQASNLPPQTTTDIVIDVEPEPFNPMDLWFTATTSENDPYPSVGSLHTTNGILIGSGILIRPDVVLTAGHVVDDDNIFSFIIGEEEIMVKDIILHPDYSSSFGLIRNDIALVFLECDSNYEPAKLGCVEWLERYDDITTVGYSHEYKKYSKPNVFRYFGTVVEEPKSMKFIPRPISVWFGDSGGGVFAKYGDEDYLIGIISSFTIMKTFGGIETITECSAVIVSKYLTWIEGSILHAEMEEIEKTIKDGR